MSNFYKIPEELAEKIRRESAEIANKHRSRAQEYDAYTQFIESQKKEFQEAVALILDMIGDLILRGKLYIHTRLLARIKDPESALHNDDISQMDKNMLMDVILNEIEESDYKIIEKDNFKRKEHKVKVLDDVFGITIITDTQEEVETLREALRDKFFIHKEKVMNKEQYHATHISLYSDRKNEDSPVVECQLKTRQDYIQSYDHTIYKVETNIERELDKHNKIAENQKVRMTQQGINKVENIIQKYYEDHKFSIFTNIPRMWEATFSEEDEEMKIRNLTEAQILKRVYPSLVIRSDKSRN